MFSVSVQLYNKTESSSPLYKLTQSINRRDTCRLLRTQLSDMDAEVAQQERDKYLYIYIYIDAEFKNIFMK